MRKFILLTLFLFSFVSSAFAVKQPTINGLDRATSLQSTGGIVKVYDADWIFITPDSALIDNGDGTATIQIIGGSGSTGITSETDPIYNANKAKYVPYTGATGSVLIAGYDVSANRFLASGTSIFTDFTFQSATGNTLSLSSSAKVVSLEVSGIATTNILSIKATNGNYYLPYTKGSTGQVITLQTNGESLFQTPSGQTTPSGVTQNVQYNNSGAFGGATNLDWDNLNSTLAASGSIISGSLGGVYTYSMGSGIGTIGFNSFGYAAGVDGYGALMQLVPTTGEFDMFLESNVAAGAQHGHTITLKWDGTGAVTIPISTTTPTLTATTQATSPIVHMTSQATANVLSIGYPTAYTFPKTAGATGQVITAQSGSQYIYQTPVSRVLAGSNITITPDGGVGTVTINAAGASNAPSSGAVIAVFDGGGSVIATNSILWVRVPYSATLTEWDITAYSTSPTLVIDVQKSSYAGFGVNGNTSIASAAKPTLTAQQKNTNTTLTGWTKSISVGDYIYFVVNNVDTATYAVVSLSYTK